MDSLLHRTTEQFAEGLSRLPHLLSTHVLLTVLALGIGVLLSLVLGIAGSRRRWLGRAELTTAGVIQTIPSIALLALIYAVMILSLTAAGITINTSFWTTIIALTLYSMLPVMRNTVTGLQNIDPRLTEAARAMGMTWRQSLVKVELPLATPVIIAGVRTATVWIVGIATLSTPVGQPSLGDFIFTGLQLTRWGEVLLGCVAAAALAIVLDLLIALLQQGVERRAAARVWIAIASLLVVFATGLAPAAAQWVGTISEASRGDRLTLAGDYEFFGRPEWQRIVQTYDLHFDESRLKKYQSTLMYQAVRGGEVDVISAFSSDGRIAAYDLVVLDDPKHAIPPYDAMLMVSSEAAEQPGFIEALRPLVEAIDDESMREANYMVDREQDKKTADDAAAWLEARIDAERAAGEVFAAEPDGPRVVVGAKTFDEQFILGSLIRDRLRAAGFRATKREGLGSVVVFTALANNEIDVYVDYSGTIWAVHMHRKDVADADTVYGEVADWLKREHGIVCVGRLGFENAYALAMRRDRAALLNITSIGDLAAYDDSADHGGDD